MKQQKNIWSILGLILGVIFMFLLQHFFFNTSTPSLDENLRNNANEMNKHCPFMVNQDTRLDNTIALPNNIIQYNFTLVNVEKDSINIEALVEKIKPIMINKVKSSPELKVFKENDVTLVYSYSDKMEYFLQKFQ